MNNHHRTTLDDYINEKKKNKKFKKAYETGLNEFLLGNMIKAVRQQRGLTQKELAHLTNTKQSVISRLEKDGSNITVGTLKRIVHALGFEVSFKVTGVKDLSKEDLFAAA